MLGERKGGLPIKHMMAKQYHVRTVRIQLLIDTMRVVILYLIRSNIDDNLSHFDPEIDPSIQYGVPSTQSRPECHSFSKTSVSVMHYYVAIQSGGVGVQNGTIAKGSFLGVGGWAGTAGVGKLKLEGNTFTEESVAMLYGLVSTVLRRNYE